MGEPNIGMAIGTGLHGFASGMAEGAKMGSSIANARGMRAYRVAQAIWKKSQADLNDARAEALSKNPPLFHDWTKKALLHESGLDHYHLVQDHILSSLKAGQPVDPVNEQTWQSLKRSLPKSEQAKQDAWNLMRAHGIEPITFYPNLDKASQPDLIPPKSSTAEDLQSPAPTEGALDDKTLDAEEQKQNDQNQQEEQQIHMENMQGDQ